MSYDYFLNILKLNYSSKTSSSFKTLTIFSSFTSASTNIHLYIALEFISASSFLNEQSSICFVNKCSFSGLTESSSFSQQASISNFSMNGIEKLTGYQEMITNWKFTNESYEQLLTDDRSVFIYLDPPYEIKDNLYGGKGGTMHKRFDHDEFAIQCDRYASSQLVSYNSDQIIRDRFDGWTVAEFAHTYTMRSVGSYNIDQASRKELVLYNY